MLFQRDAPAHLLFPTASASPSSPPVLTHVADVASIGALAACQAACDEASELEQGALIFALERTVSGMGERPARGCPQECCCRCCGLPLGQAILGCSHLKTDSEPGAHIHFFRSSCLSDSYSTSALQGHPDAALAGAAADEAATCCILGKTVAAQISSRNPAWGLYNAASAPDIEAIIDKVGVQGNAEKEQVRRFLRRDGDKWSRWALSPCQNVQREGGRGGTLWPVTGFLIPSF